MSSMCTTSTLPKVLPSPHPDLNLHDPEVVQWQTWRDEDAGDSAINEVTRLFRALDSNEIGPLCVQYSFESKAAFAQIHRNAAVIEWANDTAQLRQWNDAKQMFPSFVVAPLPGTTIAKGFENRYLVLVDFLKNSLFPAAGDRFHISFVYRFNVGGEAVDPGLLNAVRIENPFAQVAGHALCNHAAIRVTVPTFCEDGTDKNLLKPLQLSESLEDILKTVVDQKKMVNVIIHKADSMATYLAEMAAISFLTGTRRKDDNDEGPGPEGKFEEPGPRAKAAFERLINFEQHPSQRVNVFEEGLQGMHQPLRNPHVPALFKKRFADMNAHHKAAFAGLQSVPDRLHMVTGCPGAGKTSFNLTVAALAMTATPRRTRCLYVIDLNSAATDVANRMYRLIRDAGVHKRVIRMRGFPAEMKQSAAINLDEKRVSKFREGIEQTPDFSNAFVLQASISASQAARDPTLCPSLDEAAWEVFESNREEYVELASALERALHGRLCAESEKLSLRNLVFSLYSKTLAEADFVCTTPVAVASNFPKLFRPHIVFIDEAPHAREPTSLIPIAFFEPKVWILSGDHLQTRPFVANAGAFSSGNNFGNEKHRLRPNPWAKQLAVSTMERAQHVQAVEHHLLINHRAFGNLQALPSRLFYGGRMMSAYDEHSMFPEPVLRMKRWIERRWLGGRTAKEPRLLVHLKNARESKVSNSRINHRHFGWTMARVRDMMGLERFVQVDKPGAPGTILIVTPYRAAHSAYQNAINELPPDEAARVQARTIDSAQGYEADVVIIDLVRSACSSEFLEDPHRLNVALTRARACEFILMQPGMRCLVKDGFTVETKNLSKLWTHCEEENLLVELGN